MSTRATYEFHSEGLITAIYIHSDGYPLGAASYFANAVTITTSERGGMAERFIRANPCAELTDGHKGHGDTEYRYTLERGADQSRRAFLRDAADQTPDKLTVQARAYGWGANEVPKWRVVFAGPLADFLNAEKLQAKGADWCAALLSNDFRTFGNTTVTVAWLTEQAKERMAYAYHATEKGWSGNASGSAGDAARYVGAGANIPIADLLACLTAACESCPHMVAYYMDREGLTDIKTILPDGGV